MTRYARHAVLGLAAAMGLWLGGAHAAMPHAAAHAPNGKTVLSLMLARTARVFRLHGNGTVQGPAGTLTLSGDCAGTISRSHRKVTLTGVNVMSWVHGFLRHAGKTTNINVHLISVQRGTGNPQAWSRSPSSGNRWRVAGRGAGVAEIYSGILCFPLYARSNLGAGHATWLNLGAQTVNGHSAWQIQSRATRKGVDSRVTTLYVDQSSHDLLRYDDVETPVRTHASSHTSIDFSGFNEKLKIVPPKVGATTP